jgi:predicted metal-dependent hydrolase
MQQAIHYGDALIAFTINFVQRSAGRVAISVLPDGHVHVDAPLGAEPLDVVQAVRNRARWLWQALEARQQQRVHVLPREYVSGESHLYLGRRHVLKVQVSASATPGVKMLQGRLEVTTNERHPNAVKGLLDHWYVERATQVFSKRIAECAKRVGGLETLPGLRLRRMKTRWGSCSPKGELLLNPPLVKAPGTCIDYVLCHELCHLKEYNHSDRFYRLLSMVMPDWELRKRELDGMAEVLLNR